MGAGHCSLNPLVYWPHQLATTTDLQWHLEPPGARTASSATTTDLQWHGEPLLCALHVWDGWGLALLPPLGASYMTQGGVGK